MKDKQTTKRQTSCEAGTQSQQVSKETAGPSKGRTMAQRHTHLQHVALVLVLSACGDPLLNDLPELKGPSAPLKNP